MAAFEQYFSAFERLRAEEAAQFVSRVEDGIRGCGVVPFGSDEQYVLHFALSEHIDNVLVLDVRVSAEFAHGSEDARVAVEGVDGRMDVGLAL